MAKILIYNENTNRMETYYKGEAQAMPYNTNNTLLVSEFRGRSTSNTLWTTRNTMLAWNAQRYIYVEPLSQTPSWVHFDKRSFPPACTSGGYPTVKFGSKGVYVLVLQDGLNTLGFSTGGLDGVYGNKTLSSVQKYQALRGLKVDGIVGCNTWKSIQNEVVGIGRKSTTID